MKANRKIGMAIGILFIMGTLFPIISFALTGAIENSHEYLIKIANGDKQFILGVLFLLLMGVSLAFIPIILYPTLKKRNETLAIGYVIFRSALETIITIAMCIGLLLLVFVSKSYVGFNGGDLQSIKVFVDAIINFRELGSLFVVFVFGIGALMFYLVLYQSKLVPYWISVWGIIAIIVHLMASFLVLFGLFTEESSLNSILSFPIFLQEMVMAVWLITKGFNPELFEENNGNTLAM